MNGVRRPDLAEMVAAIRAGLDDKLTRTAIAVRLHCSKNVVSGIINRHIQPPKPRGPRKRRAPRRAWVASPAVEVAPPPPPPPEPTPRPPACQWPIGDDRPWRFCEDPAEPGLPYCAEHCNRAYQRWAA